MDQKNQSKYQGSVNDYIWSQLYSVVEAYDKNPDKEDRKLLDGKNKALGNMVRMLAVEIAEYNSKMKQRNLIGGRTQKAIEIHKEELINE